MASIDDASEEARNSLEHLLNDALEFATEQVAKRGGFLPFAMTEDVNGERSLQMVGDDDLSEDEMIEELWRGFRERADELVAVAVAVDAYIPVLESDAIQIETEHRERISDQITQPYRRKRLRRSVELGEGLLGPGIGRIWPA